MTIAQHIKGMSTFQYYRKGYLYYKTDDTDFQFYVPVEDIGDATFNAQERSMLMMRYIRKCLNTTG